MKLELAEAKKARKESDEKLGQLREDYDSLDAYAKGLRNRHKASETGKKTTQEKFENTEALTAQVKELQDELQLKEPLFQIGLAVRLRFLESNHTEESRLPRSVISQKTIIRGNAAAHAGSGQADANIFQGDLVDEEHHRSLLKKVFENLYHCDPSTYHQLSPRMQKAIDHVVSIRALRALNVSCDRPIRERQSALEHYAFIEARCQKMSSDEFEEDPEIGRRLDVLKEMTEKVIQMDRFTKPPMPTRRPGSV